MKKYLLGGAAAAAILATGAAFAQVAPTPPVMSVAPQARMAKTQTRADVQAHVQRMFARLDTNRDGFITQNEVQALQTQFAGRMQQRGEPGAQPRDRSKAFDRLDANHDGSISRDEFAAAPQRQGWGMRSAGMHRGFAGHMFEMADANKDGRVSLAEAQQAALQHFDRADLNHDGILTPQERQQAREQFKAQRQPS